MFGGSLTNLDQNYQTAKLSTILQTEALYAIRQNGTATAIAADSRLGFIAMGSIASSTATASLTTAYQSRLEFMRQCCQLLQGGTSTRPIMSVDWTAETAPFGFTFNFNANKGTSKPQYNLEYGGLVTNYRTRGGFGSMATTIKSIGQKQDGMAILYSTQTYLPTATYGIIEKPTLHTLLPSQAALDLLAKTDARQAAQANRDLWVTIRSNGLSPTALNIGDQVPVTVKRGNVNLDHVLYTIWGIQWNAHGDGSEEVALSVIPTDEGVSGTPDGVQASPSPTATPPAGAAKTYTVKAGDSLSRIGATLGIDWRKIAALNGIKSPWKIVAGQTLRLP
jgi:LysM repeat protein